MPASRSTISFLCQVKGRSVVVPGLENGIANEFPRRVLHPCYINTAVLSGKSPGPDGFQFRSWSGARDLNPRPHGPEL